MRPTAFVICGALGAEVKDIVDRRGWDVDIYGVSALLHLYPSRIVGRNDGQFPAEEIALLRVVRKQLFKIRNSADNIVERGN